MIVVQAAINLSVVLALVPTKGIPLPFVSYGGSSLVASWIAGGMSPEYVAARSRGKRMTAFSERT
jgi:cell division protein FtsW